jgi:hypothetical protein
MNERIRLMSLEATCGNRAAAEYLLMLVEALHLWDDLIDRDAPLIDEVVNRVFTNLLVEMPKNIFFQQNHQSLLPVLVTAIQNWHVANAIERRETDLSLEAAFIIRSSYVDVVTIVATICGGYAHGVEVAKRVRQLAHEEGFMTYKDNLAREEKLREGSRG